MAWGRRTQHPLYSHHLTGVSGQPALRATPTEAESWVQMEPLGERSASEIRKSVRRNQIRTLRHSNANYSLQGPQIRGGTLQGPACIK